LWRPREIGGHLSELGNRVTAESILVLLKDLELPVERKTAAAGLSEKM
jgi:hypothetical protein